MHIKAVFFMGTGNARPDKNLFDSFRNHPAAHISLMVKCECRDFLHFLIFYEIQHFCAGISFVVQINSACIGFFQNVMKFLISQFYRLLRRVYERFCCDFCHAFLRER